MQDNLLPSLIALKNNPAFPAFLDYVKELRAMCAATVLDPRAVNNDRVLAFAQGQADVYSRLIDLFEKHLDIIKENGGESRDKQEG